MGLIFHIIGITHHHQDSHTILDVRGYLGIHLRILTNSHDLPTQSSYFHTSLGHTLGAPESPREELHDRHHLVAIARHAVARLAIALDLQELEQPLELIFRRRSHSRAI
jgi:hypothetical protein